MRPACVQYVYVNSLMSVTNDVGRVRSEASEEATAGVMHSQIHTHNYAA